MLEKKRREGTASGVKQGASTSTSMVGQCRREKQGKQGKLGKKESNPSNAHRLISLCLHLIIQSAQTTVHEHGRSRGQETNRDVVTDFHDRKGKNPET
ncbi:hypothetical protein H6P81_015211 [Aristolochia fimbriata]|uniref:Uncharacterized protein n=1 Tax=Aristolochia fimbriata TaxID=158543 RepID=A0AAV7E640_ARIFI|nr:hypothetical protein H6P81_015211 [Aristolochia fimbriata]